MDVRLRTAVNAYAFFVIGAFLAVVPWSAIYEHTVVVAALPVGATRVVGSGWFRGAISGIGILDLWVAAGEIGILWRSVVRRAPGRTP